MQRYHGYASVLIGCCLALFLLSFISAPPETLAVGNMADLMCIPARDYSCPCGPPCKPGGLPGGLGCPCFDITNDFKSAGICLTPLKCEGKSLDGMPPMLPMIPMPMMMPKMMTPMQTDTGLDACFGRRYTTTASTSDPCADYVPNLISDTVSGGTSGISSSLFDVLRGSGGGTTKNSGETPAPMQGSQTPTQKPSQVQPAAPGLSGDVRVGSAGATIIANLRQGLSEVAGFFGGSTGGASGALSAAGRLCSTRPWQGSFVSNLIPSSFFDGLCEWRGYQVGIVAPARDTGNDTTKSTTIPETKRPSFSFDPGSSNVPPEVEIWAEPAQVRLGTRTYIFWNARGVLSCQTKGPSFSQNSLAGGASTVPLSGPTTFNIQCLTSASTTVTDSVTVHIAI